MTKFNFLQKILNKPMHKAQHRGNTHDYVISFENTILDWYTNTAMNFGGIATGGDRDLVCFPGEFEDKNTTINIHVFRPDSMANDFSEETFKKATNEGTAKELMHTLVNILIGFDIRMHEDKGWEQDGIADFLDGASRFCVAVKGTIKNQSIRTHDYIFPWIKQGKIIMLEAICPWSEDERISKDVVSIAKSIQF